MATPPPPLPVRNPVSDFSSDIGKYMLQRPTTCKSDKRILCCQRLILTCWNMALCCTILYKPLFGSLPWCLSEAMRVILLCWLRVNILCESGDSQLYKDVEKQRIWQIGYIYTCYSSWLSTANSNRLWAPVRLSVCSLIVLSCISTREAQEYRRNMVIWISYFILASLLTCYLKVGGSQAYWTMSQVSV